METTYYTVPARRLTVSSAAPAYESAPARELVCLRRQAPAHAGKPGQVIDFTAWKQAHPHEMPQAQTQAPRPVSRPTRAARLLVRGEWAATLSVIGTMLLLMWRILAA